MKIIVYNTTDQYALSRAEIETLRTVLPKEYWAKVSEFHLAHSHPKQAECFEYDEKTKIAYLIMPVKEKNPELRSSALEELLLGLARIRGQSRFFHPLKPKERASYQAYISEWLPRCELALAPR